MAKIVIVGPVPPYRGGISHYNRLLFREIAARRCSTVVITFRRMYPRFLYPGKSDKEPGGGKPDMVNVYPWLDSLNPFTWIKTLVKIRQNLSELVVIHWWTAFWSILVSFLCIGLRVGRKRPKLLFICHNIYDHEGGRIKKMLTNFTLRLADIFLVHSQKHKEVLQSLYPSKKVVYHPMPVFDLFPDGGTENPRAKLQLPDNARVGLFFGFIRPYKGLDVLIQAMPLILQKIPDFHLLVAGEAMYELNKKYSGMVNELGLKDHVSFHWKYIPMEDAWLYFRAADVLILPYKKASGSALVTLGFHYKLPVIATRTGNFEEIIEHDKNGYLVEPENMTSLAQIVIKYFANEKKVEFTRNIQGYNYTGDWSSLADMIIGISEEMSL